MKSTQLAQQFQDRCANAREHLLKAAHNPETTQNDLLHTLIRRNVETAFGKEHDFATLRTVADFQRAVPIRDYHAMAPWLSRCVNGEASVLTGESPAMYALWGNFLAYHPELVEHEDATLDLHWDRRPVTLSVGKNTTPVQSMAQRYGIMHADDFCPPWYEAAWFRPQAKLSDYSERMFNKIVFFALKKVRAIATINPITLHLFAETLAKNTERLIEKLHRLDTSKAATDRLAAIAKTRNATLLPKDLWPDLSVIGCRKSATAALYLPRLQPLFGEHISLRPYSSAGAEGSQAIPINEHSTAGVAALCSSFMEFLPATEPWRADSQTSLLHELLLGGEYQTVLTTPDGLYRYAVGDVFKVVEFIGPTPMLEYVGRTQRISSMAQEQLSEREIVDAAQRVCEQQAIRLSLFTCCPVLAPQAHYLFLIESTDQVDSNQLLAEYLDDQLCIANPHYQQARTNGSLAPAKVRALRPGTFYDHWHSSVNEGKGTIQLQIQALQQDDTLAHLFA